MQFSPLHFTYCYSQPNIPKISYFQTPTSFNLIDYFSHLHKITGKITVLFNHLFISNNTYLRNNTLLRNNPFDKFSRSLPERKHFSPVTGLSQYTQELYKTVDHQYLPDCSFVTFNTASRCQQYNRAKPLFGFCQLPDKFLCQQLVPC